MARPTLKDIIRNILLNADTPLAAYEISDLWPHKEGMPTSRVSQLLHRMKDVVKVGQTKASSITNDSYVVETWTHVNHEHRAEWVDESTNE